MIVLLPGLDGTGRLFEPFLRALGAGEDVMVIHYPDRVMSYPELETYVVDRLPPHRPITLIAESFSGPIALQLSQRTDVNLKTAVLVCSFAAFPTGGVGKMLARAPWKIMLRMRLPSFVLRHFLVGENAPPELVHQVRATIATVSPNVLAKRVEQALTSDYCEKPVHPRCRVVALYSEEDRLLGHTARRSIQSVCSPAEMKQICTPHFALPSEPVVMVQALREIGVLG